MKKIVYVFLGLAITFIACDNFAKGKVEISQFKGPDRTGIYPAANLLDEWPEGGPELIWKYDSLGGGYASAAVLSDKVITIATLDSISYAVALNHQGELLYKEELGAEWMTNFPGNRSTPIVYDDLAYFQGSLGVLYCFNADNGKIVWTKDLFKDFDGVNNQWGITENFVIDGEKLFVTPGGKVNNIIALNRFNGDLIWSAVAKEERSAYGAPNIIEVKGVKYLINFTETYLHSLNPETGEVLWSFPFEGKSTKGNVPVYKDGYLYAMAGYKNGTLKLKIADDGRSVEQVWINKKFSSGMDGGLILDDKFYSQSNGRPTKLFCSLDLETANIIDSIPMNPPVNTIAADDKLYVYQFRTGIVHLIDIAGDSLNVVGKLHIEGGIEREHCSVPVIHNGRLYVRHDNSLFVYNLKK